MDKVHMVQFLIYTIAVRNSIDQRCECLVAGIFSQMPKYTPGIFWLSKYLPLIYCILCDKSNFTT